MNRHLLIAGIVLLGTVPCIAVVRSTLTRAAPTTLLPLEATVLEPSPTESGGPVTAPAPVPTPETRLEQRRMLYETVDGLLQVGEFERARRVLDDDQEHRGAESKPWLDLAEGYRLLADCLEHSDGRFRGSAEAFLRTSEASALHAKLRAACFEPHD